MFFYRYSFYFILIFFSFSIFSQELSIKIKGKITDDLHPIVDANIIITQNSKIVNKLLTDATGHFNFSVPFGVDYLITVSKDEFVSKKFDINTNGIPPEKSSSNFKVIQADITLFKRMKGVDYSILDQPIIKYSYNAEDEVFDFDEKLLKDMLNKIETIHETEDDITLKQQQEESAYKNTIKLADKAFSKEDWQSAIVKYKEANKINPKESYPLNQLDNITKLVSEKLALENKAKEDKALAEKALADKAAADKLALDKAKADKLLADKALADKAIAEKAAADKLALDKAKADKLLADKALADKVMADKAAADKLALDKAKADKLLADKALTDKAIADKAAADKLALDKAKADKALADKALADKAMADKTAADKLALDKAKADKALADKALADKVIADKAAADKLALDKAKADKLLADKALADKALADKAIAEKAAADKLLLDKAKADKLLADKAAADKAIADKAAADKLALDKAKADKVLADKAAADKAIADKAAAEKLASENKAKLDLDKKLKEISIAESTSKTKVEADRLAKEKSQMLDYKFIDIIAKADKDFSLKRYIDAKNGYVEALLIKVDDSYSKGRVLECVKLLGSDGNQNIDERQKQLLAKYKPGVTEEIISLEGVVIVKRVLVKNKVAYVYEKKIFNWGGVSCYRDNESITLSAFDIDTKK
jgi:hypothetical protein